jgi:PAS domain S-box-containing protein/putative nucleotidyltransferase with HDIG domain
MTEKKTDLQKQSEVKLQQTLDELFKSEERFRSLVSATAQIVWTTDAAGNVTDDIPSWRAYTGQTIEQVRGAGWVEALHPDDLQRALAIWRCVVESRSLYEIEYRVRRHDGQYRDFATRGVPLQNADGSVREWVGYCADITERKKMENDLRNSEAQLRAFLDTTPFPIAVVDTKDNNIYFWSQSALTLFGHTAPTAPDWFQIAYPDPDYQREVIDRWKHFLEIARESLKTVNTGEYRVTCRDGSERICELYATFLKDKLIVTFNDITDRKWANLKLEKQNKELVFQNEEKEKRAAELVIANKELVFQNEEKEKRAAELVIANKELAFQNEEKEKRAAELVIANKELEQEITARKQTEVELQQTLESLKKAIGATIQAMVSAIEMRDPYTAGHQLRVADLACTIATEMGFPDERIEGLRMAGSIHDIGKLSIPAELLSKPTKLTNIEFSLIKEHARSGYEMLKNVESPWPLAQIVYQHHERMDGSGYPRNLKGDEILLEARIMAVADVVEAMASHRPYRAALGIEVAMEEIEKNKGIFYDNTVADACLKLFREKGYQLA